VVSGYSFVVIHHMAALVIRDLAVVCTVPVLLDLLMLCILNILVPCSMSLRVAVTNRTLEAMQRPRTSSPQASGLSKSIVS